MKKHLPMREIRMLAVLPLLLFTLTASARTQDGDPASVKNGRSFAERLMVELSVGAGTGCNGVKPLELSARIGYRFVPRVYAFVQSGALYGLYDEEHGQHYSLSQNLGGGLGWTVYKDKELPFQFDLRGSVAAGIGNADWKHVVYDIGFVMGVGRGLKFNVGAGFRHVSSRTAGIGTYNGLYCTLGVGF